MADEDDLLRLIGRIYEAATDPAALGTLAADLSQEFASNMVLLYIVQNPRGKSTDLLLSATATFDDWAHASYTGYYRQRDIWGHRLLSRPKPAAVHGFEVLDQATLERSEVYSDYYRRAGVFHALAGSFPVATDMGVLALSRQRQEREFDDRDKARLDALVPHVQRAVQIQQRLIAAEQQSALSFEMLERLGLGIAIVDAECRLLFANGVARQTLQAADGLSTAQGRLRPRQAAQTASFQRVVRQAVATSLAKGTSPGGIISLQRPKAQPLPVLIAPYRAPAGSDGHLHGAALVLFSDPGAFAIAPESAIAQMFGLSPAEARFVSALVAGQTMGEYANSVGISMNTAKTYMRQIFQKTGFNRQTDIVRAAMQNPIIRLTEH